MHRVWILALASVLAACSSQDDPPETTPPAAGANEAATAGSAPSTGEHSRREAEALAGDPQARREAMPDSERRAAVRERLRELRHEGAGDRRSADGSRGGESRRRGRAAPWWENEAIARDLGLSEAQAGGIGEAHADLMEAARRSRQQLARAAGDLEVAAADSDRERLGDLAAARVAALDARAQAEAEWMRRVLDTLDDEQLHKLARERPELLGALFSPLR